MYGNDRGAASSRCSAATISPTALPMPLPRAEQRRDVDRNRRSGAGHRPFVPHRLGAAVTRAPGNDRADVPGNCRSYVIACLGGRGLPRIRDGSRWGSPCTTRSGSCPDELRSNSAPVPVQSPHVAPQLARFEKVAGVTDLGDVELAAAQRLHWPAPSIVTRAQWGANERIRKHNVSYNRAVSKIVVHHTGTPNDITDYPGLARGIYVNEIDNGYIDIAYNWLIDPHGRIYEGRWAQDYPHGYVHNGERDRENVMGAHALYFNEDTIGIGLMGDYSVVAPSAAMVERARHPAHLEVRALGHQSARLVALRQQRRAPRHRPRQHLRAPRHLRDRVPGQHGRGDAAPAPRPGRGTRRGRVRSGTGSPRARARCSRSATSPKSRRCRRHAAQRPAARHQRPSDGQGYWLSAQDGGVFTFGNAKFFGSTGGRRLNQPIVGMAATPTGKGYWLVARDGGVFCFGDAKFFGSTGALRLNSPMLGITPTSTGKGYWLYAQRRRHLRFGDAKFFGSTGGIRLNQPIVGMAARPQNDGYWMVAADGGIFGFGHAPFKGSGASRPRSAPTVSMVPSTSGNGYALLLADGSFLNVRRRTQPRRRAGPHLRSRGRDGRLPATPLARRRTWRPGCRSFVAFVMEGCRVAAASKRSNPHGYLSRQSEAPVEVARDRVARVERRRAPPASGRAAGTSRAASSGRRRESFVRYTRPPASATSSSRPSSSGQRLRPRRGMSSASVQPGIGNPSSRPAVVLEALQHREERRASAAALSRSSAVRTTRSGAVRHDELVLHEPVRAVDAVPVRATPSSGWKNGVMPWIWPRGARGALRNHTSLNARIESGLSRPFGIHGGARSSVAGRELPRAVARSTAGSSSRRRVVAAREHRAAEAACRSRGSRSTRRSTGSRSSPSSMRAMQSSTSVGAFGVDDDVRRSRPVGAGASPR